ncbi:hypothetical protein [Methylocaldum szegediense]|jgi:hypothetical protein|uniref:hypothetical protein n=1 Tax=Methylocaldum szegediense TaxID=73780 RepID=UPI000427679A|nr:hypothetical protein [Methylocaldum szegediense]
MPKVSYRLPDSLLSQVKRFSTVMYGPKGKSKWICEAIRDLVSTDPGLTKVGLGEDLSRNDALDIVNVDEATWDLFEQACHVVRRQDPLFDGVRSAVIRAAIRHRIDKQAITEFEGLKS